MNELKLGAVDARFADIVWESSPMSTGELVKRCAEELNWKRPTVYSALRKFCDNGIFCMENGTVTVLITRDRLHAMAKRTLCRRCVRRLAPIVSCRIFRQ